MEQIVAKKLDIRCFIEGFEVPCVSAALSINYDSPAACTVQCIPTPSATRLKPRSSIHVFVRDTSYANLNQDYSLFFIGEIVGYQFQKSPVSLSVIFQAVDDSSYWDTAYQYFTDYGSNSDWLSKHKSAVMGTGVGLFDSVFREHASVIGSLLRTSPKTYPQLKGLAGGVVHIIEAVGGIPGKFRGFNDFFSMAELRRNILGQITASEADKTSVNIYNHKVFWQWLLRGLSSVGSMVSVRDMIKLLFQYIFHNVVPNPIAKFEEASQVKDIKTSKGTLANTVRGKKILASLKQLEKILASAAKTAEEGYTKLLMHTIYLLQYNATHRGRKESEAQFYTDTKQYTDMVLAQYKQLESKYPFIVGKGGRLIKKILEDAKGIGLIEGPLKGIPALLVDIGKRFQVGKKFVEGSKSSFGLLESWVFSGICRVLAIPKLETYHDTYDDDVKKLDDELKRNPAINIQFPPMQELTTVPLLKALKIVQQIMTDMGSKVLSWKTDYTRRSRLNNQIFRPDVWFAAPPRCNVIFPDDYMSFQYSRSFMQEVTRMELTTAMELIGSNMITNRRYLAPNIEDITGQYTLQSAKGGVRLILPHEIYTGILPKFEFMSEANIFAAKGAHNKAKLDQQADLRKTTKELKQRLETLRSKAYFPAEKSDGYMHLQEQIKKLIKQEESLGLISYSQRVVNWQFFKNRFAARSMALMGNYMYRLVAGFPGVVINIPKFLIDEPPHYIGMIAGLNHNITHEGGATSVSFSDSREHSGFDDDYLGIAKGKFQNITRGGQYTTVIRPKGLVNRIATITALIDKYRTSIPEGSRKQRLIKKQEKLLVNLSRQLQFLKEYVNRQKTGKTNTRGMKGPRGGVVTSIKPDGSTAVLEAQKESTTGAVINSKTGLPFDFKFHTKYIIKEAFASSRKKIMLPPEEQVYPPWLSPIYRNELIGKPKVYGNYPGIYPQFFGCQAITDDPGDTKEGRAKFIKAIENLETGAQDDTTYVGQLRPAKSIEEAVDEIAAAYLKVRNGGQDIQQFIDAYTFRPVATMAQILGSEDLEIDKNGKVVQGKVGFHSFAFGDFENLEGFQDSQSRIGLGRGKSAKIARGLDTRRKKYQAVLRYVQELNKGAGQLGG